MTVPLKYGRVTRYQPNSDQLRRCSFEVVGLNGHSTGCLLFSSFEEFNKWFSVVHSNIRQLMELEVSRFNERIGTDFPPKTEPLLYMGWLGLTLHDSPQLSRLWQDVFLALRGDDLMLFEVPPIFLDDWKSASVKEKVYKCVIRVLDDEELLDKRLNAFFLHCGSAHTFYMSAETVGDVSRLERCWFRATSNSLAKKSAVGSPVLFKVSHNGQEGQLVFDLDKGISFAVGQQCLWTYRFACLKRSYDDRDRKLFLHFQDPGSSTSLLTDAATTSSTADGCVSGVAIVKEVEVPDLQLLLIVLHSFLSSKLTAVDPQFLKP
ncbi:hypothetical protein BOX15_Mlig029059g1 [Macrostomum lignano]|uniref:Syntrophin C-terminal PH domain-containing protein n=1 Tax=Macrostomum lignano TaxID=282301 RepID=A0A267HAN4_9PLAT|nr:hypothetical protein BOX15_Mlig029059g1 [Macrostomum lignano]